MRKIILTLLVFVVVCLCSCSSNETIKSGSFTLECPKDLELVESEDIQNGIYREVHYLTYSGEDKYDRTYLFGQEDNEVFEITLILNEKEPGKTAIDYSSEMRASLTDHGNGGWWTVFSEIENKEDSISFKASPNRKEIQDYGVQYYRFFEKDGGIAVVQITVREDANNKYENTIKQILNSVK